MRHARIASLSLAGLGLALLTAACGGSAAVTGAGGEGGNPITAPSAASGNAAVQGSVLDGTEGLRVDVVGTSLSTRTDEEGQFAFKGVPAGTVTLRFQGSGVDAQLAVPGVQDGKVTTIKVNVSGSTARMPTAPTCTPTADTFFTGVIESITGQTFVVAGRQVDVSQVKKIWRGDRRIDIGDLHVGDKVKVWGTLRGDGVVVAEEIALMAGQPGDDGTSWIAFTGTIESVSSSAVRQSCLYPTLVVSGRKVVTGEGTAFVHSDGSRYDPAELKVGHKVYVEGWKHSNGDVNAKLVRL
jgi:hypothetical protein